MDLTDPLSRVLCCFGQAKHSGQARRSEGAVEAAVRMGDLVLDCGLRLVASERVSTDAQGDVMSTEMILLLLVPASHHEDGRAVQNEEEMPDLEEEGIPYEVDASSATVDWVAAAARSLVDNGACVLRRPVLIPADLVELCRADARPRLDRLLRMAAEASAAFTMWSKESAPEAIRFRELYSRAPWECRFDVTVPHRHDSATTDGIAAAEGVAASGGMDQASSTAPWRALLEALDPIVRPVLKASALLGSDDEIEIDHVGFVLSEPRDDVQCDAGVERVVARAHEVDGPGRGARTTRNRHVAQTSALRQMRRLTAPLLLPSRDCARGDGRAPRTWSYSAASAPSRSWP
jgi:hypothetical protein